MRKKLLILIFLLSCTNAYTQQDPVSDFLNHAEICIPGGRVCFNKSEAPLYVEKVYSITYNDLPFFKPKPGYEFNGILTDEENITQQVNQQLGDTVSIKLSNEIFSLTQEEGNARFILSMSPVFNTSGYSVSAIRIYDNESGTSWHITLKILNNEVVYHEVTPLYR